MCVMDDSPVAIQRKDDQASRGTVQTQSLESRSLEQYAQRYRGRARLDLPKLIVVN